MDEQRRYFLTQTVDAICTTVVRVTAIVAIAVAFAARSHGAEPLRLDPYAVDPKLGSTPATVAATPAKRVDQVAPGWHVHRCPSGHEWSHPDTAKGSRPDHTCPECGAVTWSPVRTGVRLVEASPSPWPPEPRPTPASVPTVARGNSSPCPGGVCPRPSFPYRR